jgi:hypothetical protein
MTPRFRRGIVLIALAAMLLAVVAGQLVPVLVR